MVQRYRGEWWMTATGKIHRPHYWSADRKTFTATCRREGLVADEQVDTPRFGVGVRPDRGYCRTCLLGSIR